MISIADSTPQRIQGFPRAEITTVVAATGVTVGSPTAAEVKFAQLLLLLLMRCLAYILLAEYELIDEVGLTRHPALYETDPMMLRAMYLFMPWLSYWSLNGASSCSYFYF